MFDATFFQSHQLLATPDLPVEDAQTSPTVVRFDPPQAALVSNPTHMPASPAEASTAKEETKEETIAPATRAAVRPQEQPSKDGATQLRFDPPVGNTSHPTPAALPETEHEPSAWHQTIAAVDNAIRRYHRIIMLVALITATGLMMLVVEGQQSDTNPDTETITPPAISTEVMEPLPLAEACSTPAAVPERVAEAKGPQSIARQQAPDFEVPKPEVAAAPEPVAPQPEIRSLPKVDQVVESTADEEFDEGYKDTGKPAFTFGAPTQNASAPPQARLTQELKPVNQQTR